ncbi:MAG: hypothetical protein JW801_19045 [Bacteroidales bacterium]|nr:hypothetical protein [Bacteroidales bacterium]
MIRNNLKYLLRSAWLLLPFIVMGSLQSCQKTDCQGCYPDAPWSAPGQSVCYPDKDMCEDELGVECYRCNK